MVKTKIYLAGGWFNEEQRAAMNEMRQACTLAGKAIEVYDPMNNGVYRPGDDPSVMVNENLLGIKNADMVLASTEGKDMGTLFECGYAKGIGIPVVYYYPRREGKFNIMLSGTAMAVLTSPSALMQYLHNTAEYGMQILPVYKGEQE